MLTSKEVARLLKLHEQTLRRWRSQGKGPPFFRVGGGVRYDPDAVKQWIDDQNRIATEAINAAVESQKQEKDDAK